MVKALVNTGRDVKVVSGILEPLWQFMKSLCPRLQALEKDSYNAVGMISMGTRAIR